jgi:hypothetical protein
MSVTPTRCRRVQAGLAAGNSILGVWARRFGAAVSQPAAVKENRRRFKFIRSDENRIAQCGKSFLDGEGNRILGALPSAFDDPASVILIHRQGQLIHRFIERVLFGLYSC